MSTPGPPITRAGDGPDLLTGHTDGVLTVTLNRPDARNAMTIDMRRQLARLARRAATDDDVRVIVLTGAGTAFCSGVDLRETLDGGPTSPPGSRTDPASVLRACRVPVIGAINGPCYTGGLELALSCSFLVAAQTAVFADTHAQFGLLAGWGMSALLPRAVGVRMARQMMLTGEPIDAAAALAAGLVNEVHPVERLLDRAQEIARRIAAADRRSAKVTFDLLAAGEGTSLAHALALEAERRLTWQPDAVEVHRRFTGRSR